MTGINYFRNARDKKDTENKLLKSIYIFALFMSFNTKHLYINFLNFLYHLLATKIFFKKETQLIMLTNIIEIFGSYIKFFHFQVCNTHTL